MYDHDGNDSEVKESAVAKSTGEQDEKNMLMQDAALFRVLSSGKKISKEEGMLPGDIVWNFIKKMGRKLKYEEGYVIEKGADGFQCKECKFYMYSGNCLLIRGKFRPDMSCGFIV